MSTAQELVARCLDRGVTVATAESLTAGLVSATIAEVPGCSGMLRGGVVAYATDLKGSLLGLGDDLLSHVVSEPVALAMAQAVANLLDADLGLATTGVAGPDAQDGQPPGTVWIAVFDRRNGRAASRLLQLPGDRQAIRSGAAAAVLGVALDIV